MKQMPVPLIRSPILTNNQQIIFLVALILPKIVLATCLTKRNASRMYLTHPGLPCSQVPFMARSSISAALHPQKHLHLDSPVITDWPQVPIHLIKVLVNHMLKRLVTKRRPNRKSWWEPTKSYPYVHLQWIQTRVLTLRSANTFMVTYVNCAVVFVFILTIRSNAVITMTWVF